MIKPPIDLQDLRRRIYAKAKAEPSWRFWGLYVHVCKLETLARSLLDWPRRTTGLRVSTGSRSRPSRRAGWSVFLEQIRDELVTAHVSAPAEPEAGDPEGRGQGPRPVDPGDPRPRGPGGAEAHPGAHLRGRLPTGSFGYRPKRTAHEAVHRVAEAIVQYKTRVIDIDLQAYFDNVRHDLLLAKVARAGQ